MTPNRVESPEDYIAAHLPDIAAEGDIRFTAMVKDPLSENPEPREISGTPVGRWLAVHRTLGLRGNIDGWTVSHVPTGWSTCRGLRSQDAAMRAAGDFDALLGDAADEILNDSDPVRVRDRVLRDFEPELDRWVAAVRAQGGQV